MTKYDEPSPWLKYMKICRQKILHKLNYIIVNFTQNSEVSVYIKNKKIIVYQILILKDSDEQNGTTRGYTPQQWVNFAKTIQQSSLEVITKKMTEVKEQCVQESKLNYGAQKSAGWLLHAVQIRNGLKYIRTSYRHCSSILRNWKQRTAFMQQQNFQAIHHAVD